MSLEEKRGGGGDEGSFLVLSAVQTTQRRRRRSQPCRWMEEKEIDPRYETPQDDEEEEDGEEPQQTGKAGHSPDPSPVALRAKRQTNFARGKKRNCV